MRRCRSCGAPIRWARTRHDTNMPLDADPHPDGNITFDGRTARVMTAAELTDPGLDTGAARYRSHFSTCPNAAQHRKPKR